MFQVSALVTLYMSQEDTNSAKEVLSKAVDWTRKHQVFVETKLYICVLGNWYISCFKTAIQEKNAAFLKTFILFNMFFFVCEKISLRWTLILVDIVVQLYYRYKSQ